MNKTLKHIMIYAGIIIFSAICLFGVIWNFLYCKDMAVCVIIVCYMTIMLLLSDSIQKGLS